MSSSPPPPPTNIAELAQLKSIITSLQSTVSLLMKQQQTNKRKQQHDDKEDKEQGVIVINNSCKRFRSSPNIIPGIYIIKNDSFNETSKIHGQLLLVLALFETGELESNVWLERTKYSSTFLKKGVEYNFWTHARNYKLVRNSRLAVDNKDFLSSALLRDGGPALLLRHEADGRVFVYCRMI